MRVKEIIIDGFKSYAVRTTIAGWDESFNSITGRNGSGKSNILDAICFVLGITSMATVRAQNLQDLIYKRGQAGVTKASVTIIFDNSDSEKSPYGYEDYPTISVTRQIIMGGTNKYLINGVRAQQQTVHNLFQSVQLNINNPNFLIMQGRITKVLNMKATEILGMIEEAAGTRMFEDRKIKAEKTMSKKDKKIEEINELLKEEIEPKLEKLRAEKRAFLDFQQTQTDLERLTKLVVAHDYLRNEEKLGRSVGILDAKRERCAEIEEAAQRMKREITVLEEDMKRIEQQRENELRKGGKFQALEKEVKEKSHEMVRIQTALDLKIANLAEERGKLKAMEQSVKDQEKQLKAKAKAYEVAETKYNSAKAEFDKETKEAEEKEELLQTLQTGVASKAGQESGYQAQLQEARNRANAASTEQEQAKLKIANFEKRIREEEPRAAKAKKENLFLIKNLDSMRAQAKVLEQNLGKMGYQEGRDAELQEQLSSLESNIRRLREQADGFRRRVANVDFNYSDPSPNFDRSKVKGLVAQLFTLDKDKAQAGTALEICAGGRLYNVVVDNEVTGSQLLQNGKLKKRVTIIPLNKIQPFRASANAIATTKRIAPGKADLALSLIGYDNEVSAAMEYVFGSTLICNDPETAKKVTFNPDIRLKSVTLEGDVYDPSGTLSGGSAPNSSGVLVILQQLNQVQKELQQEQQRHGELRELMAREGQKMAQARDLKQQLDLKNHEISLTEGQINSNSSTNIIQAVEELRANIAQLKVEIEEAKTKAKEAQADVKRIEKDMKDFEKNKDGKLAELQKDLDSLKKSISKKSQGIKTLQKEYQTAQLESEQAGGDLSAAKEALEDAIAALKGLEEEIEGEKTSLSDLKSEHEIAQASLRDEKAKLSGFDDEKQEVDSAIRAKTSQIAKEGLELQKLKHEVEKLQKEHAGASQLITNMEFEFDWIADEKEFFGRPNTPYDFKGQNIQECKASLKNLNERFAGMKKKINPKVMSMIDNVEKKEASLKNMLRTVNRDKRKIEETIEKLQEYKREALEKTWRKVTADFGQIFADLLPGSFAKLEPPEGKDVTQGLEVKVRLGQIWKASLTELSGGQRSLIALSLILALLQFKPAPMYILDEVDAALDLSHTQNIGRLFRTRFKGAQFIVVSLKDGMFQNANKIFRTRFQDGTSVVTVERGKQ